MKNKMQRMMGILCALLLLTVCLPGYAAVIDDVREVTYYQNGSVVAKDEIQPGQLSATVRIKSSSDQQISYHTVLAVYAKADHKLLDVAYQPQIAILKDPNTSVSGTWQADRTVSTGTVTVQNADDTVSLYVWKDMTPIGKNGENSETDLAFTSHQVLSGVKVGSYPTFVQNGQKVILVYTDEEISNEDVTVSDLPAGCSYTVASDRSSLTLTKEDGTQTTYAIIATTLFEGFDFQDNTPGDLATSTAGSGYKDGWYWNQGKDVTYAAGSGVAYVADPQDEDNIAIKITDSDTTNSIIARYNTTYSFPFSVSYRVMYTAPNDTDDPSYSDLKIVNQSFQEMNNMTVRRLSEETKEYNVYTGNDVCHRYYLSGDKWNEYELVFLDANTVKYYINGTYLYTLSAKNAAPLGDIRFKTGGERTSVCYLDDVVIRDLSPKIKSVTATETGGNTVSALEYAGTIYVNADNLDSVQNITVKADNAAKEIRYDQSNAKVWIGDFQYPVVAKNFFADTFENGTVDSNGNVKTTVGDKEYTWGVMDQEVSADGKKYRYIDVEEESDNHYITVAQLGSADGTDKKPGLKLTLPTEYQSIQGVFDFDVRYRVPAQTVAATPINVTLGQTGVAVDATQNNADFTMKAEPNYGFIALAAGGKSYYGLRPTGIKSTSDGTIQMGAYDGLKSSQNGGNLSATMKMGQWHHCRIVYKAPQNADGSSQDATAEIYIDGNFVKEVENASAATVKQIIAQTGSKRLCHLDYDNIIFLPLS